MWYSKVLHLKEGKRVLEKTWNILLFKRRTFTSTDNAIEIPAGQVLQLHSPIMEKELIVNGEAYIL